MLFFCLCVGMVAVDLNLEDNDPQENRDLERNYEGEYYLGLIPNSPELPATKADVIVAQDKNKEMIQSPFGYVYLRNR